MIETIKLNVLYPLVGRLGTAMAVWLVGNGVHQTHADWVATGVLGIAGIAFDLGTSWVRRRWLIDKTFAETVNGVFNGTVGRNG